MTTNRPKKNPTFSTPVGEIVWADLNKPNTKFKKETGEYSCKIRVSPESVKELKAQLEALATESRESLAKEKNAGKILKYKLFTPFTAEEDSDGNPTGSLIFTAKISGMQGPEGEKTNRPPPPLFDAALKPIVQRPMLGRGSKVRISFAARPMVAEAAKIAGVTASLMAVQVISVVTATRDAAGYGFSAVEDGFTDDSEGAPFASDGPNNAPASTGGGDY